MYMPTLPVAEARAQLSRLVEEATNTHERFEITRSGQRVAVLADDELLRAHTEGLAALGAGDSLDADGLGRAMRSAGRLPPSG